MPLRTQGVCSLHIGFIRLIAINICEAVCEENISESATFSSVFCLFLVAFFSCWHVMQISKHKYIVKRKIGTEIELKLHKVISELILRIYIAVYAFQT